jgi:Ca2+/Na+ antiporter
MILGILGGLVIILCMIVVMYAFSLAIQFWFLSIPLFILWCYWIVKREKQRQINVKLHTTPYEQSMQDRNLALLHRQNDLFKNAKAREKARYRKPNG